jgi:hypothetical protein
MGTGEFLAYLDESCGLDLPSAGHIFYRKARSKANVLYDSSGRTTPSLVTYHLLVAEENQFHPVLQMQL